MSTTTVIAVAAGAALAYCIYFDYCRRSHPDYRENVAKKRRAKRAESSKSKRGGGAVDEEMMKQFFVQQMQLGQDLMRRGQFEQAVQHLAQAVRVYSEPSQLLQLLQQNMPPDVFMLLMRQLEQDVTQ
eukprot:m.11656 g.11656  ORF g.11656 m.11656 type:complete len:128 (-) comp6546_c0_seq1:114-497(-)